MNAPQIFAVPRALAGVRERGLALSDVRAIPAVAGGPGGLNLLPLDWFLFGEWMPQSSQPSLKSFASTTAALTTRPPCGSNKWRCAETLRSLI